MAVGVIEPNEEDGDEPAADADADGATEGAGVVDGEQAPTSTTTAIASAAMDRERRGTSFLLAGQRRPTTRRSTRTTTR